jgi:hypothetical protein
VEGLIAFCDESSLWRTGMQKKRELVFDWFFCFLQN